MSIGSHFTMCSICNLSLLGSPLYVIAPEGVSKCMIFKSVNTGCCCNKIVHPQCLWKRAIEYNGPIMASPYFVCPDCGYLYGIDATECGFKGYLYKLEHFSDDIIFISTIDEEFSLRRLIGLIFLLQRKPVEYRMKFLKDHDNRGKLFHMTMLILIYEEYLDNCIFEDLALLLKNIDNVTEYFKSVKDHPQLGFLYIKAALNKVRAYGICGGKRKEILKLTKEIQCNLIVHPKTAWSTAMLFHTNSIQTALAHTQSEIGGLHSI